MALADLPVWTIKPDWSGGVLERLEWLTTVLTSRTGSEQRLGFRLAPRRSFDLSFVLAGAERALFDLSVGRVGPGEWWVPLWHAGSTLAATLAAGQTYCPTATPGREWVAPGAALLLGKTAFSYEIAEVTAVGAGGISFAAGVSQTWGPDTKLYPLRRGRLSEQPKVGRKTESVGIAQARFLLTEPDDYTPIAWPVTYRGTPVLTARPDETQSLSVQYERLVAELDSTTGPSHVVDLAPDLGLTVQQHAWFMAGIAEHSDFRALLHALQGRLVPVWMPTHSADLELAATAAGGAGAITVRECGYTAFDSIRPGRQDIRLELYDGSAVHRRITASARVAGSKESLVLDTPLVSGIAPVDVRRISFMSLSRLDQDAVEIAHKTDVAGVATVVSGFRSTPENRVATPFVPIRSPFIVKTPWLCGQPHDCDAEGLVAKFSFTTHAVTEVFMSDAGPCTRYMRMMINDSLWTPARKAAFNSRISSWRPDTYQESVAAHLNSDVLTPMNNAILTENVGRLDAPPWCGAQPIALIEGHSTYYRTAPISTFPGGVDWAQFLIGVMVREAPHELFGTYSIEFRESDDTTPISKQLEFHCGRIVIEGETAKLYVHDNGVDFRTVSGWLGPPDVRINDIFANEWKIPLGSGVARVYVRTEF